MLSVKKILTISGSSREGSSNAQLLKAIQKLDDSKEYVHYYQLSTLPVFAAESDRSPWPESVLHWKSALSSADAVIICTPEYLHNLPAQIKSALEWIASSGELVAKPTIAMTYTPHEPRGARAMQSLLWSLSALDAKIIAQVNLYQKDVKLDQGELVGNQETIKILKEVLRML